MHKLSDNLEYRVVGAPVTAGSTIDSNSSRIDMADYESVVFIAAIVDSVATGVATLKVEQNDADSDSGMAEVTGSSVAATCATNDDINDKALVSEVYHPTKRYVQAVRTSATANIAYGAVVAVLRPRAKPSTQGASILGVASVAN